MTIDLRSDTVTLPTSGMREAMINAPVGDDVFGEDPSVNALEAKVATLFSLEAALFCPSGTMANQIAIKCHTEPGDEVICERQAHVYIYEGGGIAFHSGSQARIITGDRGRITAAQILQEINPDDVHRARTRLVCVENTTNRGGGSCYSLEELKKIRQVCTENKLALHLDGARLFNALVAKNDSPADFGALFDSLTVCLNKGLACPIGSVLAGSRDFIRKARRIRKLMGGGMRQAGYMAAAGIYALDHLVIRLAEDHVNARLIAEAVAGKDFTESLMPVETNIIIFNTRESVAAAGLVKKLREKEILAIAIAPRQVRLVTHLGISSAMAEQAAEIIRRI